MSPRRALVTGSAQGIGAAIASHLAESGYDVIGVDVTKTTVPGWLQFDLSSWSACLELAATVGVVDVLVNNAAVLVESLASSVTSEDFEKMIAVNLRAPFLLTRELMPGMQERKFGRVVNISSIGARTGGLTHSAVYAATKAGLISMTKHFARIGGADGVTVNAVAPGGIRTLMSQGQIDRDPSLESRLESLIPMGKLGLPDDIAHAVTYLSSEAAGFVTGITLDVNGGWVMV